MNSKIVFLFLSLLFFACANEQVEESTPELKTEVSAKDTPDPKDNTK